MIDKAKEQETEGIKETSPEQEKPQEEQQKETDESNEPAKPFENKGSKLSFRKKEKEELKKQSEESKKQIEELNDKYLRLYSEFDNYRKRTINEKMSLIKNASSEMIETLLPVLDDFERALKSMDNTEDTKAIKEGVDLIYNKLKNMLIQKGLKEMKSVGEMFNTDMHEALSQVPAGSEEDKGKVVEEIEKGYFLNDKVIRYAKVIVAMNNINEQ